MIKKSLTMAMLLCVASLPSAFSEEKTRDTNLIKNDTFEKSKIDSLNINLVFENLEIQKTLGDEILVEIYSNNRKKIPSVKFSDGNLEIETDSRIFLNGIRCKVKMFVPEDCKFEKVKINNTSGDVEISDLKAQNIKIQSTSGDIECKRISSDEKAYFYSTSGDIELEEIYAKSISLKTTSGDISADEAESDELTAKSNSGKIQLDDFYGEYILVNTTSGKIDLFNLDAEYFEIESTSGSVSLDYRNVPTASSKIKTVSGSVQICTPQNQGFNMEISSTSGTFRDKINDNRLTPRPIFTQKYYNGGATINVHTTSGSILLEN